jgi:hypothetical protein
MYANISLDTLLVNGYVESMKGKGKMGHLEFEGFDAKTTKALKKKVAKVVGSDCVACGRTGQVVMKHRDGKDRAVFCCSCAELLATELVKDAHGSYVRAWGVA